MASLEDRIKEQARGLGFELVGIAPATTADGFDRLVEWLDNGFAGEMSYMHGHAEARRHPSSILPEVQSVVMVGMNYLVSGKESRPQPLTAHRSPFTTHHSLASTGLVARYARGADYHDVLRERLNHLLGWVQGTVPGCRGRGVVDTAPLLERDFARRAGLGWFGKNAMLLNRRLGSYFFLGALLLDLKLQTDAVHERQHCGTCTACLDACPTNAFVGPGQLDARRCLSYLTIELKGQVPSKLRGEMKDWLFGCDVCQEVCPWNRKAPLSTEPSFRARPDLEAIDLIEVLGLSEAEFRARFRGTAIMRAKRRGLLRNAALILGNRRDSAALPALEHLLSDPDPVIREAAEWAVQQIRKEARENLDFCLTSERAPFTTP